MKEIPPQELIEGQKYYIMNVNSNYKEYGFFGGKIQEDLLNDNEYMVNIIGMDSIKNRFASNSPITNNNFYLSSKDYKFYEPFSNDTTNTMSNKIMTESINRKQIMNDKENLQPVKNSVGDQITNTLNSYFGNKGGKTFRRKRYKKNKSKNKRNKKVKVSKKNSKLQKVRSHKH